MAGVHRVMSEIVKGSVVALCAVSDLIDATACILFPVQTNIKHESKGKKSGSAQSWR